jgi:hypothetical protein
LARAAREVEAVIARAFEDFDVLELAADPPGWHRELEDWAQTYGEEHVIEFSTNQASRMVPALDRFRSAVFDGAGATAAVERSIANGGTSSAFPAVPTRDREASCDASGRHRMRPRWASP